MKNILLGLLSSILLSCSHAYAEAYAYPTSNNTTGGTASDVTTATTVALIAGVTNSRIYLTSWECANTGGTATRVFLEDGYGTRFGTCMLAATTGDCDRTYPTPKRIGKSATLNLVVATAGANVRCYASGFFSQN